MTDEKCDENAWDDEACGDRIARVDVVDGVYGVVIHFDEVRNADENRRGTKTKRYAEEGAGEMNRAHEICDVYETIARGETLRLCNAFRPNWTKSCGRNCSGGFSVLRLFATGSNLGDEKFSLSSSDIAELENRSLEK